MMVNKKMIQIATISIIVMFLAVSFVSAGLLDSIKKVFTKEPQLGPFNASATIQGVPPTVPLVVNISDDFVSSNIDEVQPAPDRYVNIYVTFIARDINGVADLPPVGSNVLGSGAETVSLNITYTGAHGDTVSAMPYIAGASGPTDSCQSISCGSLCGVNDRMYYCNLSSSMNFFYESSVYTPTAWKVGITVRDGGSQSGYNSTKQFSYLMARDILNLVNLSWIGLAPGATNQVANFNVTVTNKGNWIINALNMTAYNLTGPNFLTTKPFAYIPANTIRVYGTIGSECSVSATTMMENAGLNVTGINIPNGANVQRQFYFCIFPQLNNYMGGILDLSDATYTAFGNNYAVAKTADWR